jgi:hypothetical protein
MVTVSPMHGDFVVEVMMDGIESSATNKDDFWCGRPRLDSKDQREYKFTSG